MLNDGWNEGMTADESDAAASEMYRDSHPCCLSCEQPGCLPDECPSGLCDVEPLVTHDGELMHGHCVAAWDKLVENKAGAEAVPEAIEPDDSSESAAALTETTRLAPETMRELVFGRVAPRPVVTWRSQMQRLLIIFAVASATVGCAAHAPAPEVESVGQLAAGPSIWHAPVHETTAPPTVELAGSADDDAGEVATTTVRTADAGEPAAAPEVVAKSGGLVLGSSR